MSNKITRKGLSLVGALSLLGALFAGAPAQAAGAENLVIAPSTGSSFIVPADNTFTLKAYYKTGVTASNASSLKVRLTTNGTFQLNADSGATAASAVDGLTSTVAAGATGATVAGGTGTVDYVGLQVNSASSATTYTVTAQAFEDVDGSGTITGSEYVSAATTITFIKQSGVTWTISQDQPYAGDAGTLSASVTSNVNISQLENGDGTDDQAGSNALQVLGAFSTDATTAGTQADEDSDLIAATYDSVNNEYDFTTAGNVAAALATGDQTKFYLYFVAADALATKSVIDTAVSDHKAGHGAYVIQKTLTKTVLGSNLASMAAVSTVPAVGVGATSGAAASAVSGDGTVSVRTLVTPNSGVSKSGHTVTFTIKEDTVNDLESDATISVGGKTLMNTNGGSGSTLESITASAVTDADGYATITLTYTNMEDGNEVDITATSNGVDASEVNLEWNDRTVGQVRNITAIGASEIYNVPTETAYTITAGVKDQFGTKITAAGYTVKATYGSTTIIANVIDGVATLSMPAVATAQTLTVALLGQKGGVDVSGTGENVTVVIGGSANAVTNVTYSAATTGTGTNYGVGSDTDLGLQVEAWADVDTNKDGLAPTLTANYVTFTATALDASASPQAGVDVTFSGGLDFVADNVYASGSITVRTNSSGQAAVQVYSSSSGSKTLTISSGSSTKTQTLVYAAGGAATATTLEISAPSFAPSGKTLAVTGVAKDKFGNAVTATGFEVTYSGPGFYSTLPTSLTNGKFSFNVLLGASDEGTATITATIYDGTADEITVTQTVTIGESDPATQKVNAGSFKGYVAVYARGYEGQRLSAKIGDDWVIVDPIVNNQENGSLFRVTDFTGAGVDIAVRIYIDRVLIDTINLTTK